ncbi:MAG TPA: hypothetical protein VM536_11995 [Chloroflexia bacterium]|nr:hypothetical protein [Chloroflexia bacterium]
MTTLRIGLIGDYDPAVPAHQAIPGALERAAARHGDSVVLTWLETRDLPATPDGGLAVYDGLWCVPASPYAHMAGALAAIRFAREGSVPFLGTCGGFQHALIEWARTVLGLADADHLESNPDAALPLVAPLACSLMGARGHIHLLPGTRIHTLYGDQDPEEGYRCNYGLNPAYEALLAPGPLQITARDPDGSVRAVELPAAVHPFYLATLFQPELATLGGGTHPVVNGFVDAARRGVRR